jgi:hypothetical protein
MMMHDGGWRQMMIDEASGLYINKKQMNTRVAMCIGFNKAVLLLATGAPRLKSPTVGDFMAVGITH